MRRCGLHKNGLIRDFHSQSPLVRSYVTIFEQLCMAVQKDTQPLILVTSSLRGEGRTTVAANLALCCATLGGRKTLLIDADLERPGLQNLFNIKDSEGIGEVLQGVAEWTDVISVIDNGKLSLMTAGQGPSSALVAMRPDRLAQMVTQWRSQFDWIIADMPPVLTSASVLALGHHATGVLLAVHAGRTRAEVVGEASSRLKSAEVRLLGAVLNRRRFVIPRYAYRRL